MVLVFPSDACYLYLVHGDRPWAAGFGGDLRQSSRAQASGRRCTISNRCGSTAFSPPDIWSRPG